VRNPRYSVIVPTTGRPTLARTLRRIRREDRGDVEVIVVSDGKRPDAERLTTGLAQSWPGLSYVSGPVSGQWGHAQRMEGMRRARGKYLLFMDDDDIYRWRAFVHIRRATRKNPGRVIIFRVKRIDAKLWQRQEVSQGQMSTLQFVVPNIPDGLGSWVTNRRYEGDFDFITETLAKQGEPVWDSHVIATIRPLDWKNPRPWIQAQSDFWRGRLTIRTRLRRAVRRI
jgi:glycosyltransferase involved in cell wall biosynthesis